MKTFHRFGFCQSAIFLAFVSCSLSLSAQSAEDSVLTIVKQLDDIVVNAQVAPVTDTKVLLSREELNRTNTGQNLPFMLTGTPSLLVTSDDGLGVGYAYFRIRGTDQTRINMTVNGVPLNDGESQDVFWVNTADMASKLSSVNVQRGVGTSTNGSASFGASINMSTLPTKSMLQDEQPAHVTLAFNGGMYKTFREMADFSVLLPNNWRIEAGVSKINSDGFLYRAYSDLFSYHGSVGYYTPKTSVILSAFGGNERTYMAWDGVSADDLKRDRRYNPAGEYVDKNGEIAYYPNQTDNYGQQHFQLLWMQQWAPAWKTNLTLHYTHGGGYYDQYKAMKKYSSYGLPNYIDSDSISYKRTDFTRQKHLNNHSFGAVYDVTFRSEPVDLTVGGAASHYIGQHWGFVTDVLHESVVNYEYYRSRAHKTDVNVYAKANWRIIHQARRQLILYGDLQYRYVHYTNHGTNDEDLDSLNFTRNWHFFNPKAGLTYLDHGHEAYFSFAIANREPSRKNFTDAGIHDVPRPERLYDYELGYRYTARRWHIGVNLYYMDYKDQMVQTGKYSDTGAYLTVNVPKSYRAGVELTGGCRPVDWFEWNVALTWSRNRIPDFTDWVSIYDDNWNELRQDEVHYYDVAIAFSPDVVFTNLFRFMYAGFSTEIQTQAVSKQYLDNTMSETAILKPYTVTNMTMHYSLPLPQKWPEITLMAQVNNLFNSAYESNGGNWMCLFTDGTRYDTPWYYAQAGINVHGGLIVRW